MEIVTELEQEKAKVAVHIAACEAATHRIKEATRTALAELAESGVAPVVDTGSIVLDAIEWRKAEYVARMREISRNLLLYRKNAVN